MDQENNEKLFYSAAPIIYRFGSPSTYFFRHFLLRQLFFDNFVSTFSPSIMFSSVLSMPIVRFYSCSFLLLALYLNAYFSVSPSIALCLHVASLGFACVSTRPFRSRVCNFFIMGASTAETSEYKRCSFKPLSSSHLF